jgi:hypothetical protein
MSVPKKVRLTHEELEYADEAVNEYEECGHTQKACPRCGGAFLINVIGNSYSVECVNGDFVLTSRGI